MTKPINILLADDHRILRTGLKLLLSSQGDFHVAAEASNGHEVLDILKTTPVDVVLLDLSMPVMSGLDCLKEIKRRGLAVKILVLTMYSEQQYIKEVMTQGADGYICKDAIDTELFQALRRRYLSDEDAHTLLNSLIDPPKDPVDLSAREREVLTYLVHGYSLAAIADTLHISIKTVSTYKSRLMQKLGCTTKSELVDYALAHKLLK